MRLQITIITIITLLLFSGRVISQPANFNKVWVQGTGVSYTTKFTATGTVNNFLDTFLTPAFMEGNSNICDSNGNLLLCSDGFQVYDKNVNVLDGGNVLVPQQMFNYNGYEFSLISQSSIFLPMANRKYYFITPTASDNEINTYWNNPNSGRALFDLLLYNVIDMNANSGAGKVTRRMVPLLQNVELSKSQMMACRHGDGKAWWLLKQAHDTNMVYKFLFTQDSVYGPFVQGFAAPHFTKWDILGQSVFSKDGTKYATICSGIGGTEKVFVADFDRCSGDLRNPKVYAVPPQKYLYDTTQYDLTNGAAFSPNGRFLYINGYDYVLQMDLQAGNPDTTWVKVAGADTTFNVFQEYSAMYLGHDDKLYIGNFNATGAEMSLINNPDNKGVGCGFCPKCLRFPIYYYNGQPFAGISTPPCMPNYALGKDPARTCFAMGIDQQEKQETYFTVYPNPAQDYLSIETNQPANMVFTLTDITGKSLLQQPVTNGARVDITGIPSGLYLYRVNVEGISRVTGKITKN
jgi:hypothetical protein